MKTPELHLLQETREGLLFEDGTLVPRQAGYYEFVVPISPHATLLRRPDSPSWYVQLRFDATVLRPRSTRTVHWRQALADARRQEGEAQAKVNRDEPLTEPIMRELFDDFLAWHRERNPDRESWRRHEGISKNHILPMFGHRRLSSLTERDSERLKAQRLADGAKISTIRTDLSTWRSWGRFAIAQGYRKDRITAPIEEVNPEETNNSWFDRYSYPAMRRALRHQPPDLFHLVMFSHFTACRVVEARNFRFEHLYVVRGQPVRVLLNGKDKRRVVPVLPVVATIVDRMKIVTGRSTGLVWPDIKRLSEDYTKFLRAEGLYEDAFGKNRTLGSLRHTRITLELLRGLVTPVRLAAWAGHSLREQETTYSKIFQDLQTEGLYRRKPKRGPA